MGWKTDWLHGLIFQEITKLAAVTGGVLATVGPPPTLFHVLEFSDADWETVHCRGSVKFRWTVTNGELAEVRPSLLTPSDAYDLIVPSPIKATYFVEAVFAFHIATDRKRVAFTYYFGPRYAHGQILGVSGQGKTGTLDRNPFGPREWIS
jgi:hypothetical protein